MKKNKASVVITAADLLKMGNCDYGVNEARELLPATISVDPEKNIDLAIELARLGPDCECTMCRCQPLMQGMVGSVLSNYDNGSRKHFNYGELYNVAQTSYAYERGLDIGVIAQALACMADDILNG